MLGLVVCLGLCLVGYALHNKKKSNSYTVAKALESAIDNGKQIKVEGYFDMNEVIRIMAEDGYNYYNYCK